MNKLQCYGVRDSACNWFVSYLQNRKQYVVIKLNQNKEISCGVPQRSILGPLLHFRYNWTLLVICIIYFSGGPMIATRNGLSRSLHVGIYVIMSFFIYITISVCCMLPK